MDLPLACSMVWIALFNGSPSFGTLTGEARMFQLDEVGNSKKILIERELVPPASPPLISMFCRCLSMFFRPPCVRIVNWPLVVR